jgi:hypothetical protein
MIPAKWKIYRVLNYVLLVGSAFVFVKILEEGLRRSYEPIVFLIALVILFLMLQSIINLAIMTKSFPGKLLTGAQSGWHTFSTVINGISFTGIAYAFVNMLSEIDDYTYSQYKTAIMITILIFILLLAIILFIFICQLTLKRYLRRTNKDLIDSMINSIGSDELKQG